MKEAVKLGLILGAVSLVMTFAMSFLSSDVLFSWKSFVVSLAITALVLIWGGRHFFRRIPDIDLSYGVAVKFLFVAGFIGSVVGIVGATLVYGNDEKMEKAFIDYQKSSMEYGIKLGAKLSGSEARAQEMMDEMQEKIESGEINLQDGYPYKLSKLPLTIGSSAVMSLIYALIFALFVRVKYPD